jgi:hypothetical protein
MGRGKKKHQRTTAAKANNRKHRSGEKHNNNRTNSDNDRDKTDDLIDTPDSLQNENGPRTRSNAASTRKQLFKQPTKFYTTSDEDSELNRNSDMDTTDEETKQARRRVGRVESETDSDNNNNDVEIISVQSDSSNHDDDAQEQQERWDEHSDESIDCTKILHNQQAKEPPKKKKATTKQTAKKQDNTTNKQNGPGKRKVRLPPVVNEIEMLSPPSSPTTLVEPTPTDIRNECRYSITITVQSSPDPWKEFTNTLQKLFKLIHEQVHDQIHIAPWDPEYDTTEPIIKTSKDFPAGVAKNRKHYANYFSGYPNPKKNKVSRIYLKVRFLAPEPDLLPFDLEDMGQELSDSVADELPDVFFSRNPYACQAVRPECIGWFFGSTKSIDSKQLVPAIRAKLKIPDYVPIGIQWRTIKDENRKNYEWKADLHPPPSLAPRHGPNPCRSLHRTSR